MVVSRGREINLENMSMNIKWSRYQIGIFDFVERGTGSAFVSAVAGSSKTTVLVKSLDHVPRHHRSAFFAYNKHIVEELDHRVPLGTYLATLNALGWRSCLQHLSMMRVKLDVHKTANILGRVVKSDGEYDQYKVPVVRTVSLLKNLNLDAETCDLDAVCDTYDVEPPGESFYDVVREVMRQSVAVLNVMDFDDQVYVPLCFNFTIPKFDNVFIDETQDLTPAQIELVSRAHAGRMFAVGDERQAIYGFKGANPQAIQTLVDKIGMSRLPLSICYRCPKLVVAEAQKIVPEIEAWEEAKDGVVGEMQRKNFTRNVKEGDYVLCRTTAPLVESCLQLFREGRPASVQGRDIGEQVIWTVRKIWADDGPIPEFIARMEDFRTREIERLLQLGLENRAAAVEDRLDTISVVLEDSELRTVGDLKRSIMRIFRDDGKGVRHATGHRSKGLEAKRVFVLRPDLLPHKRARKEWQRVQEMNLKYVIITRAKEELYWVHGEKTK